MSKYLISFTMDGDVGEVEFFKAMIRRLLDGECQFPMELEVVEYPD